MAIVFAFTALALLIAIVVQPKVRKARSRIADRERFIREFDFPDGLKSSLLRVYPSIDDHKYGVVVEALRQYFLVHLRAGRKVIAMPSKVVDALWHELILDTRTYHQFCEKAFGGYFHHIPAAKMASEHAVDGPMRRTWHLACKEQGIDPVWAARFPLLFSIDTSLEIPDANRYDLETMRNQKNGTCGGGCGGGGSDCGGGCGGD